MLPKPNLFAQLLTEAIYKIKLANSSSIGIVQDELGYALGRNGGRAIEYWRQGNIPNKIDDIHLLVKELNQRGGLETLQNDQFFKAAGFVIEQSDEVSGQKEKTNQDDVFSLPASSLKYVPQNNFHQLVGRQIELDQVLKYFARDRGNKIVGIDGMGGIGKTALSLEIVNQCLVQGLFSQSVWLTANRLSKDSVSPFSAEGESVQAFNFEAILQGIGLQLGIIEIGKLDLAGKIERIKDVFELNSIVVILDNLETAEEPQTSLIAKLKTHFVGQCFILTSRLRFTDDIYHIHLEGLQKEESFKFFRQDALEKGIQHVATAKDNELESAVEVIGGSPLAIKLVVSQLDRLPLEQVIQDLKLSQVDLGNEYARFYKFILQRSWQMQSLPSQELLVALACFDEAEGSNFDAIQYVTNSPVPQLASSIDSLWQASLVEVGKNSLHDIRYYLHPLTTFFVLSDIVGLS